MLFLCYKNILFNLIFYFENTVTLNLMNFHSLNEQKDHVEKSVSGDVDIISSLEAWILGRFDSVY